MEQPRIGGAVLGYQRAPAERRITPSFEMQRQNDADMAQSICRKIMTDMTGNVDRFFIDVQVDLSEGERTYLGSLAPSVRNPFRQLGH